MLFNIRILLGSSFNNMWNAIVWIVFAVFSWFLIMHFGQLFCTLQTFLIPLLHFLPQFLLDLISVLSSWSAFKSIFSSLLTPFSFEQWYVEDIRNIIPGRFAIASPAMPGKKSDDEEVVAPRTEVKKSNVNFETASHSWVLCVLCVRNRAISFFFAVSPFLQSSCLPVLERVVGKDAELRVKIMRAARWWRTRRLEAAYLRETIIRTPLSLAVSYIHQSLQWWQIFTW